MNSTNVHLVLDTPYSVWCAIGILFGYPLFYTNVMAKCDKKHHSGTREITLNANTKENITLDIWPGKTEQKP